MSKKINRIKKWLEKYGGSPWRFNQIMFEQFDSWRELKYEDIFELVAISKDCIICHYSLVPFFVKYIGIDIRNIYLDVANVEGWDSAYLSKVLSIFPKKFSSIHEEGTLDKLGYAHLKDDLRKIRQDFLANGAVGISQLTIKGKEQDRILIFDEKNI